MSDWPRLRDLPEDQQKPFAIWLGNRLRPVLDGVPESDQDAFYAWDYVAWRDVPEGHRLTSWMKIPFDSSAIDSAMLSIGGICLDKIHINRPDGVRLADYRLGGHVVELKTLENEPLDVATRQERIREFTAKHQLKGVARLSPEQNHEYWTRIAGIPLQRVVTDAAEQIRKRPTEDLRGPLVMVSITT